MKIKICNLCPNSPVFPNKAAKRAHVKRAHLTKCSVCNQSIKTAKLSGHFQRVHSYTNPLRWVPGVVERPSLLPEVPLQNNEDSIAAGIHGLPLGCFPCLEHDCGRVFSSKAHLNAHSMYFHPKKHTQATDGKEEVIAFSNDTREATEEFTEHSPLSLLPTSSVSFLSAGGHPTQGVTGLSSLAGSPVPALFQEDRQVAHTDAAMDSQHTPGSTAEPLLGTQGEADVPLAVTVVESVPLLFQCRMCGAPPTTGTQPAISTCGHLFCHECIAQHLSSTPRCPVCDNALLPYCLFKLDLPVFS